MIPAQLPSRSSSPLPVDRYGELISAIQTRRMREVTDERLQELIEEDLIRLFQFSLGEGFYREIITDKRLQFLLPTDQLNLLLEAAQLKKFDFITEARINALPEEGSGYYEEFFAGDGHLQTQFFAKVDREVFDTLSEKHQFLLLRTRIRLGKSEDVKKIIESRFDSFSKEKKFALMQEDLECKTCYFTTLESIHQLDESYQNVLLSLAKTKGLFKEEKGNCIIL